MSGYFRMTGSLALLCLLSIASACTRASSATEKTVELKASAKTVHQNFFDASLKPVLTINSGDTVRLETATGNPRYFEKHGVPKDKIPPELYAAFEGLPYDDSGPDRGRADSTLNGPIKVNGAEPGDVLEVRIRSVQVFKSERLILRSRYTIRQKSQDPQFEQYYANIREYRNRKTIKRQDSEFHSLLSKIGDYLRILFKLRLLRFATLGLSGNLNPSSSRSELGIPLCLCGQSFRALEVLFWILNS